MTTSMRPHIEESPDGPDPPSLRVTIRCLGSDLEGTTTADVDRPIEEVAGLNQVVKKFVELRSQEPKGIEKVQPLVAQREVYSLHAGRWRAATWHDREQNVVWLLAGRLHRSGERDDSYPHFKALDDAGTLLPTAADYKALFASRDESFVDHVMRLAPLMIQDARQLSPGEATGHLGPIPVSVAIESTDDGMEYVYVAVRTAGWTGSPPNPPPKYHPVLWAAFFPWVADPLTEIDTPQYIGDRRARDDELVFRGLRQL